MNLLFLTYSYLPRLGGVERSVHNLALLLGSRGHVVTIVTHGGAAFPFRCRPKSSPAVVELHLPNQTDSRYLVRWLRPALNALNLLILFVFCIRNRIDIVHGHMLNMDTVYAGWLARLLGVRFVLTLRGGETEEWSFSDSRRSYLLNRLQDADFVTALSRSLLEQAASLDPRILSRAAVIPNPVDAEAIRALACTPLPTPHQGPFLLFAGRLEAMKDVACLLEAYDQLIGADPGFLADLLIVGDGSLGDALQRQALASAASARIHFLGRRSQADTLSLMRSALALILPSLSSEGCPNVLLEAMALETPVVVSDLPSLGEWVEDRVTGLVFPVGRPDRLAACLQDLVVDPSACERRVACARIRLRSRFAMSRVARDYEAIYASLAEGARPRLRACRGPR